MGLDIEIQSACDLLRIDVSRAFYCSHCVSNFASDANRATYLCPVEDLQRWQKRWTVEEWREFLREPESGVEISTLRHCTHTGRPMGSREFLAELEEATSRPLIRGREDGPRNRRQIHASSP